MRQQREPNGTNQVPPVLTATTGALAFAAMTALFPAAIAPTLAEALGLPAALVGLQIALVYTGAMTTSMIGGAITRRVGACRTTQWALLLLMTGAAVAALPAAASFALASMIIGFGYGMTNPAASHLLTRFTPARHRGLVFGIKQTGVPLGGMLAGAVAPPLAVHLGWQAALLALLIPATIALALLQTRRTAWDGDRQPATPWLRSPFADIALVWQHRPLRWLSLSGLCFAAAQLSLSVFTVSLLVADLNIRLVTAGLVMSAVQVVGLLGRICWGWLADRTGNGLYTLVGVATLTVLGAIAIAFLSAQSPLALVATLLCILSFSALGWNGVYLAEVARLAPREQAARAAGGSLFFTFAGVLLGPPAFSLLHLLLGRYTLAFAALAFVAVVGLTLLIMAARCRT